MHDPTRNRPNPTDFNPAAPDERDAHLEPRRFEAIEWSDDAWNVAVGLESQEGKRRTVSEVLEDYRQRTTRLKAQLAVLIEWGLDGDLNPEELASELACDTEQLRCGNTTPRQLAPSVDPSREPIELLEGYCRLADRLQAQIPVVIQWGLDGDLDPEHVASELDHDVELILWDLAFESGLPRQGGAQ